MRGSRFARRGKITLINVVALIGIALFLAALLLPALSKSREGRTLNRCRENMRALAVAAIRYDERNGRYPGYMNVLIRNDGTAYLDPTTAEPAPVSWIVELLPELDRAELYEQWRKPISREEMIAAGDAYDHRRPHNIPNTTVFLELLVCPNDTERNRDYAPISYVANTGMPDLPRAIPASQGSVGIPRDWQANGMFFDTYSEDKLIKTNSAARGPMVVMRSSQVRDPKDKTIMFTENLDARSYVCHAIDYPDNDPGLTEIAWGSTYMPGPITTVPAAQTTGTGTAAYALPKETYEMQPSETVLAPNAGREGAPHPLSYKYCRPSSTHPEGFNVAFVGSNVLFMRDTMSYYVYARMMASDDLAMKLPGTQSFVDMRLRGGLNHLSGCSGGDCDLNP